MAIQQAPTTVKPQLIPTNAGRRTFAGPPQALQSHMLLSHDSVLENHNRRNRPNLTDQNSSPDGT